jgi:formiminotetrahydrofolate cyclodeaminase
MKLVNRTIEDFSGMLASSSPTPGGGTCSALNALLGAGFIAMVARITAEKSLFAGAEPKLRRIIDEAEKLRRLFLRLMDEDSAAYERFALAMTASTAAAKKEEPSPEVKAEITAALRGCVRPPLELLEGSAYALRLALELSAEYYPPTASDVGIAALNLETAARGAFLTVNINLKCGFDAVEAAEYKSRARSMLDEAESLSKKIYGAVKNHVEN